MSVYADDSLHALTATLDNSQETSWKFIFSDLGVFIREEDQTILFISVCVCVCVGGVKSKQTS